MKIVTAVADTTTDIIEKVASPASRSGSVVERSGKMLENDVDPEVVALQMTKNSPNNKTYTEEDVAAYAKLYQDCKTKVVITAAQATALINDSNGVSAIPAQP